MQLLAFYGMGAVLMTALAFVLVRGRKKGGLVVTLPALLGVILVGVCGGFFLSQWGLSWRRWVVSGLLLAGVVLLTFCAVGVLHTEGGVGYRIAGCVWAVVLAVLVMGAAFLRLLTGEWGDRVETIEGTKMVVESVGIFHEVGYRYINAFVHGEQIWEWAD